MSSSSSSRNFIVHIQNKLMVSCFNIQTQKRKDCLLGNPETSAQFFVKLQSLFNLQQIKAIVFSFHGTEYPTIKKQYEFLQECRKFCQQHGIFYFFPSTLYKHPAAAISQTKTMVKEGEKVLILMLDLPGLSPLGISLIRKKDCYEIVKQGSSDYQPFTHEWKEDMIGTLKPKKIIFSHGEDSKELKKAQLLLNNYNSVVIPHDLFISNYMVALVDKISSSMDRKINQYDVANQSWCIFDVRHDGKSLIMATYETALPFEKCVVIKVKSTKRVSLFCDYAEKFPELFEDIKLSTFKCKKVTVTLKLDINSFYDFKIEPFVEAAEKKVEMVKDIVVDKSADEKESCEYGADKNLTTADEKLLEKARMIFEKQNFTVSYFADGNEHSIRDSDGMDKTPIYISFTEKKPIIGKAAMDAYAEKPKFVIFDLIKLCSISNTDIENPKWGFTLSKENDSIFIKMDTVDGERKSTVEFTLALILKNGKDRIKKEYGKKMKDIEIGFNGFVPNEILKKNFIEAGKLLNINVVFV